MPQFTNTRNWLRVVSTLFLAVLAASICELSEISAAIDGAVRVHYYQHSPLRLTGQRVVLVRADGRTHHHWGPLPWPVSRIEALVTEIHRGHPSLIVVVDSDEFIRSDQVNSEDSSFQPFIDEGKLVFVRSGAITPSQFSSVQFLDVPKNHIEPPNLLPTVLSRSALPPIQDDKIPIHYISPPSLLPSLPLHRVANSEFPSDTFTGKIVLLTAGETPWATRISTPVGPLLVSEIYAHALLGLADSAIWSVPDRNTVVLGSVLFFFIAWSIGQRWAPPRRKTLLILFVIAILLADYWAFCQSIVLIGPTTPILSILTLSLLSSYQNHQVSIRQLNGLGQKLAVNRLSVQTTVQGELSAEDDQEGFWQDLVDLSSTYFRQEATAMIAELPPNAWHLQIRAAAGRNLSEVDERRRDIRRSPFRTPYLTHRANWIDGFLSNNPRIKTLLVPLHFKSRLFGFWLLFAEDSSTWSQSDLEEAEKLGVQIARHIAIRRKLETSDNQSPASDSQKQITDFNILDENLQQLNYERNWSFELLRLHPQGMLVSTLWGKIEFINAAMVDHLREEFPEGIPGNDIRAVLARLSGATLDQAHSMMRQVVLDNQNVTVEKRNENIREISGDAQLILQKLSMTMHSEISSEDPQGANDLDHLVLLANPTRASPPGRALQRS